MAWGFVVAGVLLAVAVVLLLSRSSSGGGASHAVDPPPGCCGAHATCKKLKRATVAPVEYFEDEELDVFRGRAPGAYSEEEVESFREVLCTLRPGEVGAWLASLERREVALPEVLRREALVEF
jgi:hypothetical protein